MLIIRQAQMAVFAAADRARFETQMLDMVSELFADVAVMADGRPLPEVELRMRVCRAIQRAEEFGLADEADIERFVELSFEHGEGFEERPAFAWAGELLGGPASSGTAKMLRLNAELDEQQGGGTEA
jgi:hypothetical protein